MMTKQSIHEFAVNWYKLLDVHAPQVDFLPLLADKELEMVFPEATITGHAGFEGWFQRVIRIFFDEVHTVKEVSPVISGDSASVKVVVQWEASLWNAPEAYSKRIVCDAYQTWEMKVIAGKLVITKYVVDDIKYHEGSATL
ncbi:MAG: hypothetical protein K9H64_00145 [Bacteroidales bacterium]|nr:hypothetical protein [Bacteroidales bacterium]MCF8454304.1 hypothetical protein [Bacteroidales bacterium]